MPIDHLADLIARAGHWGYWVIFAGATLESAALVGVLVPGEALVLIAGFFAAQGTFDLATVLGTVTLGAALGDSLGYELGRLVPRSTLLRYGRPLGVTADRLLQVEQFFERHGGTSVFLGRFVGFARALVPLLAGAARMPYRRFLGYNVAGAALWATGVVLLGYFLGASWHRVEAWIGRASALLAGVLLLAWLLRERRRWPSALALQALTLGTCVWIFGAMVHKVTSGDPLTQIDARIALFLQPHVTQTFGLVLQTLTHLHGPGTLVASTAALGAWWWRRHEWRWLATLLVAVPGGTVLNFALGRAVFHARPVPDDPLPALPLLGFPSSPVAGTTLVAGLVCAYVFARHANRLLRTATAAGAVLVVSLVALAQLLFEARFTSDVVGGFAEAVAWLTLVLALLHGKLGEQARERLLTRTGYGRSGHPPHAGETREP